MPESNRDEIAKLEALYATNPAGRVFTHLAEAYRKAGEYDRARTILEQGLEKHPAYASAHVVFGRVLMDLNKSDQAVEAFRKVLQLDPHNLVALRSLGDLAREAGRNAEAMGYFEELRHLDPSNDEIGRIITELLATPGFHAAEPPEPLPELLEPHRPPAQPQTEAKPVAEAQPVAEEPVAQPIAEEKPVAQEEEPVEQPPVFEVPVAKQAQAAGFAEPEEPAASDEAAAPEEPAIPAAAAPESQIEEMLAQSTEPEWTGVESEQETLPGDLADFARHNAPTDAEDVGTVHLEDIPEEGPIDLGPSDAVIEVKPDEAFQSIDFAQFSPAEEPTFEEVTSSETTLEPIEPEPPEYEEVAAPFEPTPEFADAMPGPPETIAEAFDVAPEPEPSFEPEPPAPSGEVVTETMADLYRSQGLNDRAAEVYRALLQQRPRDLNLKIKLQQVEAARAAPAPKVPAPEVPEPVAPAHEAPAPEAPPAFQAPVPEPEAAAPFIPTAPEAASEPDVEPEPEAMTSPAEEDVHSPWTGFNQAAANAPSLYAWEDDAQNEADAGRPVSEYFRALLAWRPSTPVHSGFSEPAATSESDIIELDQPRETSQEPLFQNESMPWDQDATTAPSESAGGQSPGEDEFDDWFSAEPPQEQQEPQQPAASMQKSIADETSEGDEEDDDLEMFRSWLQSLKK
ncbi:MAG TPA: tetratricopeptide repeat protein [Longimicrobiales bacterium]